MNENIAINETFAEVKYSCRGIAGIHQTHPRFLLCCMVVDLVNMASQIYINTTSHDQRMYHTTTSQLNINTSLILNLLYQWWRQNRLLNLFSKYLLAACFSGYVYQYLIWKISFGMCMITHNAATTSFRKDYFWSIHSIVEKHNKAICVCKTRESNSDREWKFPTVRSEL